MPNRVLPESWKWNERLSRVSREARLLLFNLALTVDDYRRATLGPSVEEPVVLRSMCYPADRNVRVSDVSRWLHELQSAGAVACSDSDRGWYVEIAEELWYRREDHGEKQPRHGPRHKKPEAPPVQATLALGALGAVPESAPSSLAPVPTQAQSSRSRNQDGGAADESAPPVAVPLPAEQQLMTRAQSRGKDSGTGAAAKREEGLFARDESWFPRDEAWRDLCRVFGEKEMQGNGAMWVGRWMSGRAVLVEALQCWMAKTPAERAKKGGNAAAFLTEAWERAKQTEGRKVG